MQGFLYLCTTTPLVFLPASTGAGSVSANLARNGPPSCSIFCLYIRIRVLSFPPFREPAKPFVRVFEKHLICRTQVVRSLPRLSREPILWAPPPAKGKPAAAIAFVGQVRFSSAENTLALGVQHFRQSRVFHIAEAPRGMDKEVTGKDITVMFHHDIGSTLIE